MASSFIGNSGMIPIETLSLTKIIVRFMKSYHGPGNMLGVFYFTLTEFMRNSHDSYFTDEK
jgi:hypothetical protein